MGNKARKREEIEEKFRWQLEDIYATDQQWEDEFLQVQHKIQAVEKFQGRVGESAQTLLQVLELVNDIDHQIEKLYVYSRMRRDEDNRNPKYQTLFDRAEGLSVMVNTASAFAIPEITALSREKLDQYMEQNSELAIYKHFFDELMRQKQHILSEAEERVLAMSADLSVAAHNIFTMLNNADIKFPIIRDENGEEIELTKGRFGRFMESFNRGVRKEAFHGLYSSYRKLQNTLAVTLNSSVKKDIFYARARKYPSALEASLDQDNVSVNVYNNLIATVHQHLEPMYRYLRLRKEMLKLDHLHMYDLYVPLVQEYQREIPYETSCHMVVEGLYPLGEEYLEQLQKGLENRWIDVFENEGKTGGAYSWGTYDTHPYVLMNYDNKLDDVFTLAHEMGHSLHSYYSNQNQPYIYSQYTIFVAEVASTVNESLLIDNLLARSNDPREKMYLINHYLEQFRGTVYRQTMFAEFEKIIHQMLERGEALTPDILSQVYMDLNRIYFGEEVVLDDDISLEWARIPHFYSAFYVYKYATGFSAATALKQQIKSEGEPAVRRYLEFLKSGSSDYPINLLQKAGVDLTSVEPVDQALQYFGQLVDQFEELAQRD
ncbi:oligoendopeptidase F [Syntrophomonas erecta]